MSLRPPLLSHGSLESAASHVRVAAPAPTPSADTTLSDADLVAASAAGDRAAFDVLVARHSRSVYRVCARFAHHHEDAADLAQDTFVRAYRAIGRFKGNAAVATWLYRIAVNVCLNHVARRAPEHVELMADHYRDDRGLPADVEIGRSQEAARVRAAIAKLPAKQRATLILRVYHERSHEEISCILGRSEGTVKANFFHALRNLRRLLDGASP